MAHNKFTYLLIALTLCAHSFPLAAVWREAFDAVNEHPRVAAGIIGGIVGAACGLALVQRLQESSSTTTGAQPTTPRKILETFSQRNFYQAIGNTQTFQALEELRLEALTKLPNLTQYNEDIAQHRKQIQEAYTQRKEELWRALAQRCSEQTRPGMFKYLEPAQAFVLYHTHNNAFLRVGGFEQKLLELNEYAGHYSDRLQIQKTTN